MSSVQDFSVSDRQNPRIWLTGLLLAAAAIITAVAVVGQTPDERRDGFKEWARLAARYELMRRHWTALEAQRDFIPVIDTLFERSDVSDDGLKWRVKTIQSYTDPTPALDEFEKKALEQIREGKTEVWEPEKKGQFRYVRAFRAAQDCLACHPARRRGETSEFINENDVIAVLSLQPADKLNPKAQPRP